MTFEKRHDRRAVEKRALQKAGQVGLHLLAAAPRRTRSIFVSATTPVANSQQGEDVEVFAGLGHDAVVGGHHQDHAVHAARPGDHGLDEVLVTGHVDDADLQVGDAAGGIAQVDRHAPFFLLLQAVGLAAGQRLHQRGLAVVDVPGGAQGDVQHAAVRPFARARRLHEGRHQDCLVALQQRAGIGQHLALVHAGEDRRGVTPQAARQSRPPPVAAGTATSRVGRSCAGQRAASHLREPVDDRGLAAGGARGAIAAAIRSAWVPMSAKSRQSIRSVGTSASARASSRNNASVASSAARVSLSTRTMRASGFLRIASIHAAWPE